ncbi:MAG: hypothetical protein JSW06_02280 [Thermoplasmatales archaeon]|nr:MAG: hypothetical protein JSW06_02280 [Thermoplasmatales archaeon]
MAEEDMMLKAGRRLFKIGILIALIVGLYQAYTLTTAEPFFSTNVGSYIAWIIAIIGAIIGILAFMGKGTITKKEIPAFLMAGIALLIMGGIFPLSTYAMIPSYIGDIFAGVSMSLAIFVAPAVGILAIKAIWDIGKD